MSYSTLIAYYGPKPAAFTQLIEECQRELARMLGNFFRPYDIRQVHCTIAALDRAGDRGRINHNFLKHRGQSVQMDFAGLLSFLCGADFGDMSIQIGGFGADPAPFTSRGLPPRVRSFGLHDGKAVVMGWPTDRTGAMPMYPPRLEALRRGLQRFGILHRYHALEEDIDNDFYLRIGLYDPAAMSAQVQSQIERHLQNLLCRRFPFVLPLGLDNLAFAQSEEDTLPPATTRLFPLSDAKADSDSIARFFGWMDSI